jgi:hypothetical protein
MKISIDIDCTPQEARAFFGLPNVEPMQDALIAKMQERMSAHLDAMDPEAMINLWVPPGLKGLGQLEERFWGEVLGGLMGGERGPGKKRGRPGGKDQDEDEGKR